MIVKVSTHFIQEANAQGFLIYPDSEPLVEDLTSVINTLFIDQVYRFIQNGDKLTVIFHVERDLRSDGMKRKRMDDGAEYLEDEAAP